MVSLKEYELNLWEGMLCDACFYENIDTFPDTVRGLIERNRHNTGLIYYDPLTDDILFYCEPLKAWTRDGANFFLKGIDMKIPEGFEMIDEL